MASKPKEAPKPDPITTATSIDDKAKREAELEKRNRGGFYKKFKRNESSAMSGENLPGGGYQKVG